MKDLVRGGMEEGAFGLSSGPFYAPGSYSDTDELVALAAVAAQYDGVYTSHIRDESNYTIGVVAAVEEVIEVARSAGLPGVVTHIKALGHRSGGSPPRSSRPSRGPGRPGSSSTPTSTRTKPRAPACRRRFFRGGRKRGGEDALIARLDDAPTLRRIRADGGEPRARGGADRLQFRRFRPDESIEGRTLEDVARERSLDALETAIELIRQGERRWSPST